MTLLCKRVLLSKTAFIGHNITTKQMKLKNGYGYATAGYLPPLPVPTLERTIENFLKFAKPIQTSRDYEQTTMVANSFMKSDDAKKLQSLLMQRANKLPNWLTPWWLEVAYLSARTPLPIVTSPGVTFPFFNFTGSAGQIDCAAKIIQSALKFHHKILNNELNADKAGGEALDMSQYQLLFGTTRIPNNNKDLIRYGKDQPKWARHILVTRNGHTFQMDVYNENGQMLGLHQLKNQLEEIYNNSIHVNNEAINIVSSDDRESWAEVYKRIKAKNQNEINAMEDSLFLMCLDNEFNLPGRPEDNNMAMALHGGGAERNSRNRWFDKTLQFYVNENGYGGMTYEHTPAEGPPLAKLDANSFEYSSSGTFSKPKELRFELSELDRQAIWKSENKLERVVQNLEVKSLAFDHFGKNVPKQAKLSPDSWIQLALQLSYYQLHKNHAPAYETGTLRKFHEGRTDTIRMPTMESVHFVEAMSKEQRNLNESAIFTLLESAIARHKKYSVDVMNGNGMDRHLLGLKMIAIENGIPTPKLFHLEAYQRLIHFLLSTSQVPTKHVLPMGFGPSDPDCYGVCYNPQENRIFFTITAFNECQETSAERFSKQLNKALLDMRDIVDKAGRLKERAKL